MSEIIKGTIVLFVAFFNLILGLIVLSKNPKKSVNQSFAVICLSFIIWCVTLFLYEHPYFFPSLFWVQLVYMAAVMYMSSTLIFSFFFPTVAFPKAWAVAKIYVVCYVAFCVWLMYFTKWWVIGVVVDPTRGLQTILHTQGYIIWILVTWINFSWIAINFIIKGRFASGYQKQQLNYLWIGYILFGIAVTISDGIIPLVWHDTSYFYISAATNLCFSGLVGYIILKHRFMDIKLLIARSISYSLLLLILGAGYMGGLIFLSSFFLKVETSGTNLVILTVLSLGMAIVFQPLRSFLERITDKIFYKGHYDAQDLLHRLSQTMATTPTLSNLTYRLLEVITAQMRISKAFFTIIHNEKLYISGSANQENGLNITLEDVQRFQSESNTLVFDEIPECNIKELMRKNDISLIFPLRTSENYIGLLLLGIKSSGEIFFDNDIKVLEIVAPEMAVALQNSQRYEEIQQFNATLQEEVKRATEDLRNANQRLQKLDDLKDEFISIASHDLRSPLATTKGYTWLALTDIAESNEPAKKHLKIALESTERSISLVNDMLDVSRIEAGRIKLSATRINLYKIAEDVKTEANIITSNKDVNIIIDENNKELFVNADPDRIHQVLGNLISNAIKFNSANKDITISFKEDGNLIETSVTDQGIGIKNEDIKKLFTKFGRIESNSTIPFVTGTGLGLYICKNIVELSGGTIRVQSEVGKGSVFTFSLPKADVS